MTQPDSSPTQVRLRLLAAMIALVIGVTALIVAILLVKTTLT
jgi:hypothetical protein